MSLNDIIMKRAAIHFQNELQDTPIDTMARMAHQTLLQEQEAMKAKKARAASFDETLKRMEDFNSSSANKMGKMIPTMKMKADGTFELTASTENRAQQSARIKTELETRQLQNEESTVERFFEEGSPLKVDDLIVAGISPTDAIKMDEQRGLVISERGALQDQFNVIQQFIPQVPQTGIAQPVSGGLAIPRRTPAGKPKEIVDIGEETRIKQAEAGVAVAKEVASQGAKAGELAERDFLRANAAVDTAFDQVLAFDNEMFEKYNIKPGDYLGLAAKVTPAQWNQYKAGAIGAGKESAALVARQIIPGVRSASITNIFAKSTAEIGNTQESNANNVSASMGNAFANALSANIDVVMEDGTKARIQDVTIDPKTGKPLSQLSYVEKGRALNDVKRAFAEQSRQDYIMRVYNKNPNLLQADTIVDIKSNLRQQRIAELRSKI